MPKYNPNNPNFRVKTSQINQVTPNVNNPIYTLTIPTVFNSVTSAWFYLESVANLPINSNYSETGSFKTITITSASDVSIYLKPNTPVYNIVNSIFTAITEASESTVIYVELWDRDSATYTTTDPAYVPAINTNYFTQVFFQDATALTQAELRGGLQPRTAHFTALTKWFEYMTNKGYFFTDILGFVSNGDTGLIYDGTTVLNLLETRQLAFNIIYSTVATNSLESHHLLTLPAIPLIEDLEYSFSPVISGEAIPYYDFIGLSITLSEDIWLTEASKTTPVVTAFLTNLYPFNYTAIYYGANLGYGSMFPELKTRRFIDPTLFPASFRTGIHSSPSAQPSIMNSIFYSATLSQIGYELNGVNTVLKDNSGFKPYYPVVLAADLNYFITTSLDAKLLSPGRPATTASSDFVNFFNRSAADTLITIQTAETTSGTPRFPLAPRTSVVNLIATSRFGEYVQVSNTITPAGLLLGKTFKVPNLYQIYIPNYVNAIEIGYQTIITNS